MRILKAISNRLENPNHPSLGPTLYSLKLLGLWRTNSIFCKACNVQVFALTVVISEFIELWFLRSDLDLALKSLSTTTLCFTCVIKSTTFLYYQDEWKSIFNYMSAVEKEQELRDEDYINKIQKEYISYSRKVTYSICALAYGTALIITVFPLTVYFTLDAKVRDATPYPEVFNTWVPFDKSQGWGYVFVISCQFLMVAYGSSVVCAYDTATAVVIMTFFAGQLRILEESCSRIFDGGVSYDVLVQRVRDCHQHHVNLIKYSSLLDSLLSPILFIYIIVCSIMICASAIQLTADGVSIADQFRIAEYIVALVTQLFYYCWHSNEVFVASTQVRNGIYNSAWWSQDIRMRRNVMLLSGQLSKPIIFTAGPFTQLTVAVFINILKASYSYYTLLSQI